MPRLGPSIVRRQGLEDWLGRFKSVPVRFLVAPPGFGKTMALLGYLRHCENRGLYCTLPPDATPEIIWAAIAKALEVDEFASHDALVRTLAAAWIATPHLLQSRGDLPHPAG